MIHDTFKRHKLSEESAELSNKIRIKASELLNLLNAVPCNREVALAKTKLEECVMWATKSIAVEEPTDDYYY